MLFKLFFYFVAIINGGGAALAVSFLVPSTWPMMGGMFAGMAIGVAVLVLSFLSLGWVAGPFEIMMPGMFIVKIAGMASGMWITMGDPKRETLVALGLITGFVVQLIFNLYDRALQGEVKAGNQ